MVPFECYLVVARRTIASVAGRAGHGWGANRTPKPVNFGFEKIAVWLNAECCPTASQGRWPDQLECWVGTLGLWCPLSSIGGATCRFHVMLAEVYQAIDRAGGQGAPWSSKR